MEDTEDEDSTYSLFTVTDGHKKNNGPFVVSVLVNSTPLCLEVDTGAAITIISKNTYHHTLSDTPPLKPSSRILRTYTGEQLNVLGVLKVNMQYQSQTANLELTVVEGSGPCLLGRDWLQVLTLDWKSIKGVHNVAQGMLLSQVLQTHDPGSF